MKIQAATLKWINLLLILIVLTGYQYVQEMRISEAESAELKRQVGELSLWKKEAEAYLRTLSEKEAGTEERPERNAAGLRDGKWQGNGTGFGGDIIVEVTAEGGVIKEIAVISAEQEDSEYLAMAEKMIPEMIKAQDAAVDTVTGATMSSAGLREAVAAALEAGKR